MNYFQLVQLEIEPETLENVASEVDILKSNSSLHIQKTGENEINIVGIENDEHHDFIVDICLHHVDKCAHLDDKIDLIYKLFDDHKLELNKNPDDGQFHIEQNINIKFKSALSDLIIYFRNNFSLPILLTSQNGNTKGMWKYLKKKNLFNDCGCFFSAKTGSTHLTFGDSLSTLPASVQSFQEIFSAKDFQYQFESYASIIFPINDTEENESNLHYTFNLKLIPFNNNRPMSTNSLLLPHTTLQSTRFNQITSVPPTASGSQSEQMNDKEKVGSASANEKDKEKETEDDATLAAIPKTFAYTLSLLDCSFTKRPFPGIWQLRYVKRKSSTH